MTQRWEQRQNWRIRVEPDFPSGNALNRVMLDAKQDSERIAGISRFSGSQIRAVVVEIDIVFDFKGELILAAQTD